MGKTTIKSSINLLWVNPNPNSSFNAQTLNINTEGYTFLLILTRNVYNGGGFHCDIVPKNFSLIKNVITNGVLVNFAFGSMATYFRRSITDITDSTITFSTGTNSTYNRDTSSSDAGIPIAIYGIK